MWEHLGEIHRPAIELGQLLALGARLTPETTTTVRLLQNEMVKLDIERCSAHSVDRPEVEQSPTSSGVLQLDFVHLPTSEKPEGMAFNRNLSRAAITRKSPCVDAAPRPCPC